MKIRFFALLLVFTLMLALLPAAALAADNEVKAGDITIKKTNVTADGVSITEGYGSLHINEVIDYDSWEYISPPLFALMDSSGNLIFEYGELPCEFNLYDGIFVNGIEASQTYSLFDLSGKQVISESYQYLDYYNGYGVAANHNRTSGEVEKRVLIDKNGNTMFALPASWNVVTSAGGGGYDFENHSGGYGYYGSVGSFSEGLMWFYTGMNISKNISEAYDVDPDSISSEEKMDMAFNGSGSGGYIDMDGNVVIGQNYTTLYPFSNGLACVQERGSDHYSYIDKSGKTVINAIYRSAGNFRDGYACVSNDTGKYGYIDTAGKVVIPLTYDDAYGAGNGLFSVGQTVNGQMKYGFINKSGETVVPLEYDDVSFFMNGTAYAIKDRTVYVLTNKGDGDSPEDSPKPPAPSGGFVDVSAEAYYAEAVDWAVENGITSGTSATTFSPDTSCTRAQMVTFLWRAAGSPAATGSNPFTDVLRGSYYYDAVLWAVAQGITSGTSATTFSPNAAVSRGQTVTFLYRFNGSPAVSGNSFIDVGTGTYYAIPVAWAVAEGITNGTGSNTFSPDENCTRAQIMTFMYRDAQ